MAKGLKQGDGGSHLLTYHPQGPHNSSTWFHGDDWLDFNMFQSGHAAANIANDEFTAKNYALTPIKPTLDGEPRYEDHPINWKPANGWFDDWDVRQAAYWSMLAGACGHTYGNHNLWQFWRLGRKAISSARTPWQKAIDQPGAFQMGYLRRLFESRPWQKLVPDQSLIVGDSGSGADHVRTARADDGSYAFVYTPTGKPVTVRLDKISGERVNVFLFDPRAGVSVGMGEVTNKGTRQFETFSRGRGNDWVLILDDAAQKFPNPGTVKKP
jgi:hypothetical protein